MDTPPTGPVRVLTPDLSALTAFADLVFHLGDRLLHLDFQTGPDAGLPRRLLLYNVLLYDLYGLPVHTVVVALHRKANLASLNGRVRYSGQPGRGGLEFDYEVVRLWERPVETLLTGGLGVLPLAVLGQMPSGQRPDRAVPGVIARIVERIGREATGDQAGRLLTAAYLLTGLRLSKQRAVQLFRGVRNMRESTTYQAILEEGEALGGVKEARKIILRLGRPRFGEHAPEMVRALQTISDLERLERMLDRLGQATDWQDLLATP